MKNIVRQLTAVAVVLGMAALALGVTLMVSTAPASAETSVPTETVSESGPGTTTDPECPNNYAPLANGRCGYVGEPRDGVDCEAQYLDSFIVFPCVGFGCEDLGDLSRTAAPGNQLCVGDGNEDEEETPPTVAIAPIFVDPSCEADAEVVLPPGSSDQQGELTIVSTDTITYAIFGEVAPGSTVKVGAFPAERDSLFENGEEQLVYEHTFGPPAAGCETIVDPPIVAPVAEETADVAVAAAGVVTPTLVNAGLGGPSSSSSNLGRTMAGLGLALLVVGGLGYRRAHTARS